jgi:hypothetical protein
LFALEVSMSWPGSGLLLVTTGSTLGSENKGATRSTNSLIVSCVRSGKRAPSCSAATIAEPSSSRDRPSTNFRAVWLLYGPLLIQNSFV